jgi:hypothetical protein
MESEPATNDDVRFDWTRRSTETSGLAAVNENIGGLKINAFLFCIFDCDGQQLFSPRIITNHN